MRGEEDAQGLLLYRAEELEEDSCRRERGGGEYIRCCTYCHAVFFRWVGGVVH